MVERTPGLFEYDIKLNDRLQPELFVKENHGYHVRMYSPGDIADIMWSTFKLHEKTEEYLYMVCMERSNVITGVFELAHGQGSFCYIDMKALFTRAMLTGSDGFILVHNHRLSFEPSKDDDEVCARVKELGEMMDCYLIDFMIVTSNTKYMSYRETGRLFTI